MKNKKIWAGILVIGIILICGCKNGQDLVRSCEQDSDCKYTCGCGAINKDETCPDEGVVYDCVDHETECENGICVIVEEKIAKGEEKIAEQITITTDKTEYEVGETVEITLLNNKNEEVSVSVVKSEYYDEKEKNWTRVGIGEFEVEEQFKDIIKSFGPIVSIDSFPASRNLKLKWITRIEEPLFVDDPGSFILIEVGIGKYRIAAKTGEPEDLPKDFDLIYSNEFTIKGGKDTTGFCGLSTHGKCTSDSDCTVGGCSGELCQSKNNEPIETSCEWKDCYDDEVYGVECKCVDNKCQWN